MTMQPLTSALGATNFAGSNWQVPVPSAIKTLGTGITITTSQRKIAFSMVQAMQTVIMPSGGVATINAWGAGGTGYTNYGGGGAGGTIKTPYAPGDVFWVFVGQGGANFGMNQSNNSPAYCWGGGGTFVYQNGKLLLALGGGGAAWSTGNGGGGQITSWDGGPSNGGVQPWPGACGGYGGVWYGPTGNQAFTQPTEGEVITGGQSAPGAGIYMGDFNGFSGANPGGCDVNGMAPGPYGAINPSMWGGGGSPAWAGSGNGGPGGAGGYSGSDIMQGGFSYAAPGGKLYAGGAPTPGGSTLAGNGGAGTGGANTGSNSVCALGTHGAAVIFY